MKRVAIIGAGFTGAYLAYCLKAFYQVTVFEKSRGVGGRMSTRYYDIFEFDHGVASFNAKSLQFINFLKTFEEQGILGRWEGEYVAIPRMNQWVKSLLQDVEVHTSTMVQSLEFNHALWTVKNDKGQDLGAFDRVISTAPPIQTASLLDSKVDFVEELKNHHLKPCLVLMMGIEGHVELPSKLNLASIDKMILNSSKPNRLAGISLVIQMTSDWSQLHLEDDLKILEDALVDEIAQELGVTKTQITYQSLHRWRYAKGYENTKEMASFWDKNKQCGACGDWCFQGDVESAFLAANLLLSKVDYI